MKKYANPRLLASGPVTCPVPAAPRRWGGVARDSGGRALAQSLRCLITSDSDISRALRWSLALFSPRIHLEAENSGSVGTRVEVRLRSLFGGRNHSRAMICECATSLNAPQC